MEEKLTQERLKELINYNPITGIFTNRITRNNNAKKSDISGSVNKIHGYRFIQLDGVHYRANRLAWLYMEGYFPENDVDHENRIRDDDRWKNLRHLSRQCNSINSNIKSNNTSSVTGVCFDEKNGKWKAQIGISGKNKNLGRFKYFIDAVLARWKGEVEYNFPNCNTTSTAYEYLKKHNYEINLAEKSDHLPAEDC